MMSIHVCEFEILAHMWFGTQMLFYIRVWQRWTTKVSYHIHRSLNWVVSTMLSSDKENYMHGKLYCNHFGWGLFFKSCEWAWNHYNEQPLEACDRCKVLKACISFTKKENGTSGSWCSNPLSIHQEQSTHDSAVLDSSQSNNALPKSIKKGGFFR